MEAMVLAAAVLVGCDGDDHGDLVAAGGPSRCEREVHRSFVAPSTYTEGDLVPDIEVVEEREQGGLAGERAAVRLHEDVLRLEAHLGSR
jgi:hypothetical protein